MVCYNLPLKLTSIWLNCQANVELTKQLVQGCLQLMKQLSFSQEIRLAVGRQSHASSKWPHLVLAAAGFRWVTGVRIIFGGKARQWLVILCAKLHILSKNCQYCILKGLWSGRLAACIILYHVYSDFTSFIMAYILENIVLSFQTTTK